MQTLIITPHLMQGSMIQNAFKRKNIKSLCTLPSSLTYEWFPEMDAVLIPHTLTKTQWEKVLNYLKNLSRKVPFLIVGKIPTTLSDGTEVDLLRRMVQINESIHWEDIPLIVKESIREQYELRNKKLTVGGIKLDRNSREVNINEENIFLTRKEFYLLELLMMNAGQVITRETIVEYVWDKRSFVAQNTIDVYVSRLRRKIDKHVNKTFIKTVPCLGYQFEKMGTLQRHEM